MGAGPHHSAARKPTTAGPGDRRPGIPPVRQPRLRSMIHSFSVREKASPKNRTRNSASTTLTDLFEGYVEAGEHMLSQHRRNKTLPIAHPCPVSRS